MTSPGRFAWYELLTTDPKAAIAFYTEVVGWKTQGFDGAGTDYTMFVGSQGPVGGVYQLPEKARQMGAPPYWQANVEVANVDEALAKVTSLGGKVFVGPEDVPDIGRFVVVGDPQGAVIALFTPSTAKAPSPSAPERRAHASSARPSHDTTKAGEVSWHELYTTDNEAAFRFYEQIVGWQKLGAHDLGPMGHYLLWGREGKELGGMLTMPPQMKTPDGRPVPPAWMYYVTTTDLDAALERAKRLGARVLNGPMDVPGARRIVQLLDPQGAAFALITPPAT